MTEAANERRRATGHERVPSNHAKTECPATEGTESTEELIHLASRSIKPPRTRRKPGSATENTEE